MKYSDSVKTILFAAIDELAADPEKYAKRPGRDFIRNRKLCFKQFLLMVPYPRGRLHQRGNLHVFWPFHRRTFQDSPL